SSALAIAAFRAAGRQLSPGGSTWTEPNNSISESASLTTQTGGWASAGPQAPNAAAPSATAPARHFQREQVMGWRRSLLADRTIEGRTPALDLAGDHAATSVVGAG